MDKVLFGESFPFKSNSLFSLIIKNRQNDLMSMKYILNYFNIIYSNFVKYVYPETILPLQYRIFCHTLLCRLLLEYCVPVPNWYLPFTVLIIMLSVDDRGQAGVCICYFLVNLNFYAWEWKLYVPPNDGVSSELHVIVKQRTWSSNLRIFRYSKQHSLALCLGKG